MDVAALETFFSIAPMLSIECVECKYKFKSIKKPPSTFE